MSSPKPPITIAGCGPGKREYVIPLAEKAIQSAEVLVGSKHLLDMFPEVMATRIVLQPEIHKTLQAVQQAMPQKIVVIVSGDPGLASFSKLVVDQFGPENCRIIPGISSLQLAFARLGMDWTRIKIINAHGRTPPKTAHEPYTGGPIAVLTGGDPKSWSWTIDFVNQVCSKRVAVLENLGLDTERVGWYEPQSLYNQQVSSRTIVIVPESKERP